MQKSSKPEHQHFIPKSYLKNFSIKRGKKTFIEVLEKNKLEPKKVSTRDICVKKNIYTFPGIKEGDPFFLEKFYAKVTEMEKHGFSSHHVANKVKELSI